MKELSCKAQVLYDKLELSLNKLVRDVGIRQLLLDEVDDLVSVLLREQVDNSN